jgi:N-acetylmuramoyl-L-alanine amidase
VPAFARAHKPESWARSQFATAERMREALNGRPASERSRREYQRVIDAYRRVYFGAPTSTKADPSVVAVAELQVEEGRRFNDDKVLRSAISQYQFLRKEYPGSKYRFEALFTIAEIYKDDLEDNAKARATFQEFLKHYPRNHLADDARQAIAEIDRSPKKTGRNQLDAEARKRSPANSTHAPPDASPTGTAPAPADADAVDSPSALPASETSSQRKAYARLTGIRHWSTPDYTRVAIDVEQDVTFDSQRIDHPARVFFDLHDTRLASTLVGKSFDVDDGFLKRIRVAQATPNRTRVVLEVDDLSDYNAFLLPNPPRLIVDVHGKAAQPAATKDPPADLAAANTADDPVPSPTKSPANNPAIAAAPVPRKIVEADDDDSAPSSRRPASRSTAKLSDDVAPGRQAADSSRSAPKTAGRHKTTADPPIHVAEPTANGDRSLIRALGLKIGKIVIDPGHGGHDTGTIGPNGLCEKDVVLDVAKRLGKALETRLGAEVIYTRSDDTFIPLETRTAVANRERADLFISIHANSSSDPDARGVETYYLNFTSSPEALEVAARENAVSENSIHELQDLVKKIALKEKIDESREFAGDVQHSLHNGLAARSPAIRDRGVKKAPFIVLIGANMPSILAEISFVSNPTDASRMDTPDYRQRIADALYRGIAKYVNGLSGIKLASTIEKETGQ